MPTKSYDKALGQNEPFELRHHQRRQSVDSKARKAPSHHLRVPSAASTCLSRSIGAQSFSHSDRGKRERGAGGGFANVFRVLSSPSPSYRDPSAMSSVPPEYCQAVPHQSGSSCFNVLQAFGLRWGDGGDFGLAMTAAQTQLTTKSLSAYAHEMESGKKFGLTSRPLGNVKTT